MISQFFWLVPSASWNTLAVRKVWHSSTFWIWASGTVSSVSDRQFPVPVTGLVPSSQGWAHSLVPDSVLCLKRSHISCVLLKEEQNSSLIYPSSICVSSLPLPSISPFSTFWSQSGVLCLKEHMLSGFQPFHLESCAHQNSHLFFMSGLQLSHAHFCACVETIAEYTIVGHREGRGLGWNTSHAFVFLLLLGLAASMSQVKSKCI